MSEPTWIATAEVVFVKADGTDSPGRIQISQPEATSDLEARCFYALEPVGERKAIYGSDTLQALALALRMCAVELVLFEQRGGRIEHPRGTDGARGEPWEGVPTFGDYFRAP